MVTKGPTVLKPLQHHTNTITHYACLLQPNTTTTTTTPTTTTTTTSNQLLPPLMECIALKLPIFCNTTTTITTTKTIITNIPINTYPITITYKSHTATTTTTTTTTSLSTYRNESFNCHLEHYSAGVGAPGNGGGCGGGGTRKYIIAPRPSVLRCQLSRPSTPRRRHRRRWRPGVSGPCRCNVCQ
ncbi:hypothetical protein E2C01_042227 [Portunus trituberculatus]|uniref:Uncharacterized protein n=1 Tax=Portunus trituberculatus TaxID=210409 RepID=A0A5B7FT23_PORTR|nr:hypothetical protein [Portunus trituberculatus]